MKLPKISSPQFNLRVILKINTRNSLKRMTEDLWKFVLKNADFSDVNSVFKFKNEDARVLKRHKKRSKVNVHNSKQLSLSLSNLLIQLKPCADVSKYFNVYHGGATKLGRGYLSYVVPFNSERVFTARHGDTIQSTLVE